MTNKKIKINQYAVTNEELAALKESHTFVATADLDTYHGIDALLVDGKLYAGCDITKAKITLLTNDKELAFKPVKSKTVELALSEDVPSDALELMPEFGVTIDNNLNIQQFNIELSDAGKVFGNMAVVFWDIEGNLIANDKKFTTEEINRYCNYILEKGYYAPIVCYADDRLKIIDYDNIPYLVKMLGLKMLPVRVVSYKDIGYLANICPILYEAIKRIPANSHYTRLDSENCAAHMLVDYGDKRRMLQTYEEKHAIPQDTVINNIPVSYKPTDWNDYVPVLYFVFNDNYAVRNNALIAAVNRGSYFGRQERADGKVGTSSLGGTLKSLLWGYEEFMAEDIQEDAKPSFDNYQECKDDKDINALSTDLIRFNYKLKEMIAAEELAKNVGADIAIAIDKVYPVNLHNIHQHLQKDEIIIKYFAPK